MKKSGLINPALVAAIARLGHTQTFAVADAGLPIPRRVPVVDVSVALGLPEFADVLDAILGEVVIERAWAASEASAGPAGALIEQHLESSRIEWVSHESLKARLDGVEFVVRTGSTTPYANVICECGVPF